jgi:hypothetical protein
MEGAAGGEQFADATVKALVAEGEVVEREDLATISPYLTVKTCRFGKT